MATKILTCGGKSLTEGVDYEELAGPKFRVLRWGYIGEAFQVIDLAAGTVTNLTLTRQDATGATGDRVEPIDAVQWDVSSAPAGGGRVVTTYNIDMTAYTANTAGLFYPIPCVPGETTVLAAHWDVQGKYSRLGDIVADSLTVGTEVKIWLSSTNWFMNINPEGTDLIMIGGGLPLAQEIQVPANPGQYSLMVVENRDVGGLIWRASPGG